MYAVTIFLMNVVNFKASFCSINMCIRFVDYRSFLSIIARFRLALYVYEYLLHVGAQKAAQTFLSEVSIKIITQGHKK